MMLNKLIPLCMALCCFCFNAFAQSLPDYLPTDGLVAWYPFNGNANDESGNGNDGNPLGPVLTSDRFGIENAAYSFDGMNFSRITVAPDSSLDLVSDLTISCWFNASVLYEQPGTIRSILMKSGDGVGEAGGYAHGVWGGIPGTSSEVGLINFQASPYNTAATYPAGNSGLVETNSWYHYVVTYTESDSTLKYFLNGVIVDTKFLSFDIDYNSNELWIGSQPSIYSTIKTFNGTIDDIGIWSRALSTEEIIPLFSAPSPSHGCTDDAACNYSPGANLNDGSCTYPLIAGDCNAGAAACSEGMYWNPLVQQCMPTTCPTCPADVDQDNVIGVSDLLQMLSLFGGVCPEGGCTDPQAMNYDPLVGFNDGSCIYPPCLDALDPFGPCDDGNSNTFNDALDADGCLCEGDDYVAEDGSGPCEGQMTVNYHGYDYLLVEIGDQCWFRENLQSLGYANGDSLPVVSDDETWTTTLVGAASSWGNDESNVAEYGRLYNFHAAADERGLCPSGWQVASHGDWISLEIELGLDSAESVLEGYRGEDVLLGSQLQLDADNSSGFSATMGGARVGATGEFVGIGNGSYFHTSSPLNQYHSWYRWTNLGVEWVYSGFSSPNAYNRGFSVRCIKLPADTCFDPDGDGVCPEDEISGCTVSTACNFDASATHDDGSCIMAEDPGSACDDGDANTFNDVWDETGCSCAGVPAVAEDGSGPCAGETSVNYHGYDYLLVEIGDQCWFRENLRNEHYANGETIPGDLSDGEWSGTSNGAQAIYDNSPANLADYGRLYNWFAVDDSRGLCPSGWHVPTDGEFMTLEMELGMSESEVNQEAWRGTDQGTQMKSSPEDSPSWDGTNTSGFVGLAGGIRNDDGGFILEGSNGFFWSASAYGAYAWNRELYSGYAGVYRYGNYQRNGFSVRCVKLPAGTCYDPDGDGVCPEDEISGCTDSTACNFDASATHDDGSCIMAEDPGSACDDGDANTFNDVWDETGCSCAGVPAVAEDGSGPCAGETSVNYHGYDYLLVEIGDQCWFRENLQSLQFSNGDTIPHVLNQGFNHNIWVNLSFAGAAMTSYQYSLDNLENYGGLYNQYAVSDDRSICPSGWEVPSDEDWMQLEGTLGMDESEYYSTGWRGPSDSLGSQLWDTALYGALNSSGFSALPGGYAPGNVSGIGTGAWFWTSSALGGSGWFRTLNSTQGVGRNVVNGKSGLSVRCIKSPEVEVNTPGSSCDDGDANTFNDVWDSTGSDCNGTEAVALDGSGPCEGQTAVSYHGKDYSLVEIGEQCWFRENLQSIQFANGDTIPNVLNQISYNHGVWINQTNAGPAMTSYHYDSGNFEFFGGLYNHYAIGDDRGICPSGWEVPSDEDWMVLEGHIGIDESEQYAMGWRGTSVSVGDQLRQVSFFNSPNSTGFSALAGGYAPGYMYALGSGAWFWTSSALGGSGWFRTLNSTQGIGRDLVNGKSGLSIRCIKSPDVEVNTPGSSCDDGNAYTYNDVWDSTGSVCNGTEAVAIDGSGPCEGQTAVTYHGKDYSLVEIGEQCWFRENLQSIQFANGDTIPNVLDEGYSHGLWINQTAAGPAMTSYHYDLGNLEFFGGLYNQYAVSDDRGICPSGWEVPSDEDWMVMEGHIGMDDSEQNATGWRGTSASVGDQLRHVSFFNSPNSTGFSALAGGYASGYMYALGSGAWFWTSSVMGESGWFRALNSTQGIGRDLVNVESGLSIRCIQMTE